MIGTIAWPHRRRTRRAVQRRARHGEPVVHQVITQRQHAGMDARHLRDQHHAGAFALAVHVVGVSGRGKRRGGPSGQVGFRRGHGVSVRYRGRGALLRGQWRLGLRRRRQRTVLVGTCGARYRDLRRPVGTVQPGGPHRLRRLAVWRRPRRPPTSRRRRPASPSDTRSVLMERDQLVLVGVALRQAHVHAAGREVPDGGADGARLLARGRVGAAAVDARRGSRSWPASRRAASAAGSGSSASSASACSAAGAS